MLHRYDNVPHGRRLETIARDVATLEALRALRALPSIRAGYIHRISHADRSAPFFVRATSWTGGLDASRARRCGFSRADDKTL